MNPFKKLFARNGQREISEDTIRTKNSFQNSLTSDEDYTNLYSNPFNDLYLCNAWVNILIFVRIVNNFLVGLLRVLSRLGAIPFQ